jgi:ankyrin repeat protein
MLASEFGKPEVVEVILNYYEKVDMDVKNEYEYTAVILAAESGNIECVDLLIGNGADLNLSNKFGKTALIMAAENGHYDIVLSLSASGNADLNQVWSKLLNLILMIIVGLFCQIFVFTDCFWYCFAIKNRNRDQHKFISTIFS